jgi:hypothetical protein
VTDDQAPLITNSTIYLPIALKCSLVVALLEAPLFLFDMVAVQFVFIGGWMLILAYTGYWVWKLNTQTLLANEVNAAKLVACLFAIGLTGVLLYVTLMASYNPDTNNATWRIEAAFISNPFAALNVASLAIFGTFVADQICAVVVWLKSERE